MDNTESFKKERELREAANAVRRERVKACKACGGTGKVWDGISYGPCNADYVYLTCKVCCPD
jgi:hypothetical protein